MTWWLALLWLVIGISITISIVALLWARTAKRESQVAAAKYERAAANYDTAADTLRMVHEIRTRQEPPR